MPDTPFAGQEIAALPRVDMIYSYAGADGDLVEAAVKAGAKGLVSAGFAPGTPSPAQQAAFLEAAKSGVVVVQCSRATGRIAPRRRLRETGIVAGEDLTPQKARILLALMLLTTTDIGEIQQAFQSYEVLRPSPGRRWGTGDGIATPELSFFLAVLVEGVMAGAIYALIALAFVLVYKCSRMVNFAVGEWLMVGALMAGLGYSALELGAGRRDAIRRGRDGGAGARIQPTGGASARYGAGDLADHGDAGPRHADARLLGFAVPRGSSRGAATAADRAAVGRRHSACRRRSWSPPPPPALPSRW